MNRWISTSALYGPYLSHHGIKGQKWGIRRYQNPDGSLTKEGQIHYAKKNLKYARYSNLHKWGKSSSSNVLYITGLSGSGKSTTALAIATKRDSIIHLDGYTEQKNRNIQNKDFNNYLDKHLPWWHGIQDGSIKLHSKEYWNMVDQFRNAIDSYGKQKYKNGQRVIVEGVQIIDDWLTDNKKYYINKPVIVIRTNSLLSSNRARIRDGGALNDIFKNPKVRNAMNNRADEMIKTIDAQKSYNELQKYFSWNIE